MPMASSDLSSGDFGIAMEAVPEVRFLQLQERVAHLSFRIRFRGATWPIGKSSRLDALHQFLGNPDGFFAQHSIVHRAVLGMLDVDLDPRGGRRVFWQDDPPTITFHVDVTKHCFQRVWMPTDLSSSDGIGAPEDMVEGRTLVGSDPFHEGLDRGNLCFGGYPLSFRAACQHVSMSKAHSIGNKVERYVLWLTGRPGVTLRQQLQLLKLIVLCHDPCPSRI